MIQPEIWMHVITQNRAEQVEFQVDSCAPYLTGIRYCDGGSQDSTKKVIKNKTKEYKGICKIEYYYRKWDDNYSAQDNVLLKKAKPGCFVLIMDTDEVPTVPLLEALPMLVKESSVHGYDMVQIPCITSLDGHLQYQIDEFIEACNKEEIQPFRKNWFFKYDKTVLSFGKVHREVRRLTDKDPFGKPQYKPNWNMIKVPFPYIHYKTTYDFVINDLLHAWLDSSGQGYTSVQEIEMRRVLPEFKTSLELRLWLENKNTRFPSHLMEFAKKYKDDKGAIRNWWVVLNRLEGYV